MKPGSLTSAEVADLEKRLFFVMYADGRSEVAIAETEDDIPNAHFIISLAEVDVIRARMLSLRDAIQDAGPIPALAQGV